MPDDVTRKMVYCTVCGKDAPREITFRRYDDGSTYSNEYCKACKSSQTIETDAAGHQTRNQSDF